MSFLFTSHPRSASIGLAILRVVTGLVFMVHGYQKLFVMGVAGTAGAFSHMDAPLPGLTGPLFAVCEPVFGVLVILGLLTRIGTGWFILDMLGALSVVHLKNGWSGPGGMEFPVLLFSAAVAVFLAGPGAFAIDNVIAARGARSVTP